MTDDTIGAKLAAWQSRLASVGRNIGELNEHPAVLRMRARRCGAPSFFTGETASRVDETLAVLDELWKDYLLLTAMIDEADGLHQQSGLFQSHDSEIHDLLEGASITLPPMHTPLAERGLLTTAERSDKATPDELLAAMDEMFTIARDTVFAFDQAETALAPKIVSLAREARALAARAKASGGAASAEIMALATRVEGLGTKLAMDPLGATTKLDESTAALEDCRARLDTSMQARDALGAALVAAREGWKELQETSRRARAAYEDARTKIAEPLGLLAPTDLTIILHFGAWLDAIEGTFKSGNWRSAKDGLDKWTLSRDTRLQAERRIYAANSAPLAARDELRGRLEGLGAKADAYATHGVRFDPSVARLAGEANSVLRGQPADLRKAASLVRAYEAGINRAIAGG